MIDEFDDEVEVNEVAQLDQLLSSHTPRRARATRSRRTE